MAHCSGNNRAPVEVTMVDWSEMSWRLEDGSKADAQTSVASVRHGGEEVDLMTVDGLTFEHIGMLTVRLCGLSTGDENGTDECLKSILRVQT